MTIKLIVCLYQGAAYEEAALASALNLAKARKAQLDIVHVWTPPEVGLNYAHGAFVWDRSWQEAVERRIEETMEAARASAARLCEAHGLPLGSDDAALPRAEFVPLKRTGRGNAGRRLALCDLVIAAREGAAADGSDLTMRSPAGLALFETGRPVLVLPARSPEAARPADLPARRLAIAWNGGPTAIRAVVNAMALLKDAEKIDVIEAEETGAEEAPAERELLLRYLRAQGLAPSMHALAPGAAHPAAAVLERCRHLGSDALVMGAWGHSAFRQMLLGGFTSHVLAHAKLPLVLTH